MGTPLVYPRLANTIGVLLDRISNFVRYIISTFSTQYLRTVLNPIIPSNSNNTTSNSSNDYNGTNTNN